MKYTNLGTISLPIGTLKPRFLEFRDKAIIYANIKQLNALNLFSSTAITQSGGPIVSLTSYARRISSVHLTIETIAQGTSVPSRIILWVNESEIVKNPPKPIFRLMKRGLELRLSENFGPHTKYYPYIEITSDFTSPLVTADDDVLYPKHWLADLIGANQSHPEDVNCHLARRISFINEEFEPYINWKYCSDTHASTHNFGLGVSGVIYPPRVLTTLKHANRGFIDKCPKADDVWLHVNAVRSGCKTRQIAARPRTFPTTPNTQDNALFYSNLWDGKNDEQIKNTYTANDISKILDEIIK